VRCVEPSDNGQLLASCSNDQASRIIDSQNGETKMELRGYEHTAEAVAFAPLAACTAIQELAGIPVTVRPGTYLATGSRDNTIELWDTQSGQVLWNFIGHDNWVRALIFHPAWKFLLPSSDDYTIRVWNLATGRCMRIGEVHGYFVICLAWGPDTNSAGDGHQETRSSCTSLRGPLDQTIKIWFPQKMS
ncbi:hypothetical protein V8D89_012277, partial [Ganoderma adspersum]